MAIDINELRYEKLIKVFLGELTRNPVTGYGRDADCKVKSVQLQVLLAVIDIIKSNPDLNISDVVDCVQRELVYSCNRFKVQSTTPSKPWIDEE